MEERRLGEPGCAAIEGDVQVAASADTPQAKRNVVLCLDGTANKYGRDKTNVVKLYQMLDRERSDQLTYYQPGIGTMAPPSLWSRTGRWIVTRLDLAFAWLLEQHVCDAYRFLMRTYMPEDSIFILGFSRGAYSARVLAGMIHKVGLLTHGNEDLIPFAWATYRGKDNWAEARGFKTTFSRSPRIHFLGVWDTVTSVGWITSPRSLPFTKTNPIVRIMRHAIALDERRAYYRQNRWTTEPVQGQDVLEVWFPGVHCDVGGGYLERDSGLSKIALAWMTEQAQAAGLQLDEDVKKELLPAVDTREYAAPRADAPLHKSLHGRWWVLELLPKVVSGPAPDYTRRWTFGPARPRTVAPPVNIHPSVSDRIRLVPGYEPPNLRGS